MTTSKNQKPFKEKRKFPRITIEYDTEVSSNRGVVLNMSPVGVFIATDEPFLEETKIDITFPRLNDSPPFMVSGSVVWRKPEGIGVKFEELDEHQQEMIKAIIQINK
jgi:Tfp pilus assembly protein PilZ